MSFHHHAPDYYSWIFEPDPYEYDTSMPNSSFVKYMREQDELFYATFPEARRAAEEKKRLKALVLDHWKAYGTFPVHHLQSSIPIPLHFDYEAESPFSMLSHATAGFQPHHELGHVWRSGPSSSSSSFSHTIGGPSPTSCSAPLNSLSSPTEATSWSAFPGQIPGPSAAAPQPNLPPPPPPPPSSPPQPSPPIHHPAPTNQPPAKIAHDTNHRRPPRPRPASPSPALSSRPRTGPAQPTKPANPGLSWTRKSRATAAATTMRISPLPPNKRQIEKKPPLACLFCRGRKIACGAPLPGSGDKTCNQCQRRSLRCEYPAESRRGMRKKKVAKGNEDRRDESLALPGESILIP